MKLSKFKILTLTSLLSLPAITFAVSPIETLIGIPGLEENASIETYINLLYIMSISVAGMIAVIKIIIAGVKYMLSDVITSKEEAKKDIKGALLGLILIMSAVLILQVINPQLTNLKIQSVEVEKPDINRTFACEPLDDGWFDGISACTEKGNVARTKCLTEEKRKCDELVDGYLKAECNRVYNSDASGSSWGKCTTLGQNVARACTKVTEDPKSYDTASDGKKYFCDRSRAACTKIGGTPVFDGATAKIICR